MALIEVTGLERHFKMGDSVVMALDGVDLAVAAGEFLCLMGPSGSGKSTLLNQIGGLDSPDAGQIWVDGQQITSLDEDGLALYRRRQVGFVFQSFNLIATLPALLNVEYPMVFAGVRRQERRERAKHLLTEVGLEDRMWHRPTQLSAGQQQRVALARALINEPKILLADEPTGNLDSKTGAQILSLLRQLSEQGKTIVLVTHDPAVSNYAVRTIRMLDGRICDEQRSGLSNGPPESELP
jgi:ABC-type lipoprotein export system ATPase subunit